MTKIAFQQLPIRLHAGNKTDVRVQFAALCWRMRKGKVEICIVTTRTTGRWILPRGWPMHKHTPAQSAATEAYEEAGIRGDAIDRCLGAYSYVKPLKSGDAPIIVMVYPVRVRKELRKWPEHGQRKRKWLSPKKAAKKLQEPELKQIVATFKPKALLH
ncbi:NUDIX hydrolase [Loktanella sp. D2R18]|uniref:NUDIX hydrolase n=1 Tax=Rhodobacterales TaxID=204455 RepID=UPI000DE93B6A|nr:MULTISPECIES: NUDIX hydrolase [Rhodobacterales]MDO6590139.1 NUDIX hydrolase [Yoonia sp. 1_MG-2023]RBW45747.1 NUDIX hydrolase [Loktanella sp. D2R18]